MGKEIQVEEHLLNYYNNYDEENRLLSRHGQVEYLTTMKYILKHLESGMRILEIGAGTGRYSIALAKLGYEVDAIELIPHNIDIFKSKITKELNIHVRQGNALDLSDIPSESYDCVLLLGPMYHLYEKSEQRLAMSEALRVSKIGAVLYSAYCMADPSILIFGFAKGNIHRLIESGLVDTETFTARSTPAELFQLYRTEDINDIMKDFHTERLHFIGTDMATNYNRSMIDAMDDDTFDIYMKYHFCICERQDMVGASHHTLDVFRKNEM